MRRFFAALAAVAALACAAVSASAQQATDYTVSQYTVGSKYESPPAAATTTTISGDDVGATVQLPFTFTYFGTSYTSCTVDTNGWLSFVIGTQTTNYYTNSGFPLVAGDNGVSMYGTICPYWDDLYVSGSGTIKTWTTGAAPSRHFVVSWESVTNFPYNTTNSFTFQVQLYEASNSIVFAYVPGSTWYASSTYTTGIEAADGRYQFPSSVGNPPNNVGQPPNDFSFDLPRVTFTGSVLYDRYVVDQQGIGHSSQQNIPLSGFRVEARDGSGNTVGVGTADANGAFSVVAAGVPPATFGTLVVCSQNSVCSVRATSGGALYATPFATGVSYASDLNVGTISINESADPGGSGREALNIAHTIQTVYDWCFARTADTIPPLAVVYATSSSAPTSYTAKAGATPASMTVSGASSNPDAWDVSVIRKTYGRHVLGAIAADPTTTYSSAFDAVSDPQNAFAEGFGYYLDAVVSGDRFYYDGSSASSTTVIDLEDANPNSRKGPDVAAWVAEALYDLVDGADEPWDTFAGAGAAGEQAFHVVDSLTQPVTATTFFNQWLQSNYDGPSLSLNFIHHGLLADDADEPNDDITTAAVVPQFGFILAHRILNLFNEDWYRFTLPEQTDLLTVAVAYDHGKYASAQVALELRTSSGSLVAVGNQADANSPIVVSAPSVKAADYCIRVSLTSGGPVGDYTVQAFSKLVFKSAAFQPWTVNRPYNVPLSISGGIPPYALTIPSGYVGPQGLVLDGDHARVTGTPVGPDAGVPVNGSVQYSFLISAQDSAQPPNLVQGLQAFTLNDVVRSRFAEFVAFAQGKATNHLWPHLGGTPPYTTSVDAGALPDGVTAQGGADLRFVGNAAAPGGTGFTISATDVAGSSASTIATAVVCVPAGPVNLAAGKSACGFYFDAVAGTNVGLSVSTAKKQTVRALRMAMYDVDGIHTLPITPKAGKGKIAFTGFLAPTSGRYFCVVASDDALGATSLVGALKAAPPTSGKGSAGSLSFGDADTLPIPVGILNGGTLTLTVKPDKSGLHVHVLSLIDPDGNPVVVPTTAVKTKGATLTFTWKATSSGTWTAVIGAQTGPRGTFSYTYKVKQPKGVLYSAD